MRAISKRAFLGFLSLLEREPEKWLVFGYLSYMVLGWALLCLPVAQSLPVSAIDNLFIAVSAVSTTGLVTVDPSTSYTLFGEIVILLLIQVGGLGYMTLGSFLALAWYNRVSHLQEETVKTGFRLPESIDVPRFIHSVILFTLICEFIGAITLYLIFTSLGIENAIWNAIFHAVSAFCTAGFSLFSDSLEGVSAHMGINIVVAVLSILGAMGFIIVVDSWRTLTGHSKHLGFTSKVIVRVTLMFLLVGTALIFLVEPTIADLPARDRLAAAFFQVMSASTTVGFNTIPIGEISNAAIVVLLFLMLIGASPAGTGGGIKTTSFVALFAILRSTLRGRSSVRFMKRRVPQERLQSASASALQCLSLVGIAVFLLTLTESGQSLNVILFEAVSAVSTVGLSMGLTSEVSYLGKVLLIILMIAGRVGVLTFGIAFSPHDETRQEEKDNDLVT